MEKRAAAWSLAFAACVLLLCRPVLPAVHLAAWDSCSALPLVVNTWGFSNATLRAWHVLTVENGTALDAVEQGCSQCEEDQCDGTVGYGGSPDEDGETTLDALIIDGPRYAMGAVGDLRRVKRAISVARAVMERSTHTFLVGEKVRFGYDIAISETSLGILNSSATRASSRGDDAAQFYEECQHEEVPCGELATQFAVEMGFQEESLSTNHSKQMWQDWQEAHCQPNYRQNVVPDPRTSCGPYRPTEQLSAEEERPSAASELNHDTIGMVVIDAQKRLSAGTSTNGMNHKIPGRIGDSPIPGAGAYADQEVGGAAATGDGDILMRYLPSYQAVESMRRGVDPRTASVDALHRIVRHHPKFVGGLVAVSIDGTYGAACHGIPTFPYSVAKPGYGTAVVEHVHCTN